MNLTTINFEEGYAIYCQKPVRRTIIVDGQAVFLSFPYLYFKLHYIPYCHRNHKSACNCLYVPCPGHLAFAAMELIFSSGPKENLLFYPPLPNTSTVCFTCLGDQLIDAQNLDDLAEQVASVFWQTKFKTGEEDGSLRSCFGEPFGTRRSRDEKLKEKYANYLDTWAAKTKDDPQWIPSSNDLVSYPEPFF